MLAGPTSPCDADSDFEAARSWILDWIQRLVKWIQRCYRRAPMDRRLLVIGVVAGLLSGLLGVGGGIVMVPLLVLWAGYGQREAHATSLGAIVPISLAGVLTYGIAGPVRVPAAAALAVGSVAGARVGAGLLARLNERALKSLFGA